MVPRVMESESLGQFVDSGPDIADRALDDPRPAPTRGMGSRNRNFGAAGDGRPGGSGQTVSTRNGSARSSVVNVRRWVGEGEIPRMLVGTHHVAASVGY
jgi:hypothetical protein